jgi:replicative DNA helicase
MGNEVYRPSFSSQSSGVSEFDSGNTIKIQSRANQDDSDDLLDRNDRPPVF